MDDVDFYKGDDGSESDFENAHRHKDHKSSSRSNASREMEWSAPEYVDHKHSFGWYLVLTLVTAALAAGIYFLAKDYFAVGSIAALGLIVGVFASRTPRDTDYRLSDAGLEVGKRKYAYSLFKSFTISREAGLSSVELVPLKRFMPSVSAYFKPAEEKRVTEIVGEHLPYAEHKPHLVDSLSHRLHF